VCVWGGGTDTHDSGMHVIGRGRDVTFDLEYVLCGYGSGFVGRFVAFESYKLRTTKLVSWYVFFFVWGYATRDASGPSYTPLRISCWSFGSLILRVYP
jgi:hypothetical protein